MPRFFKSIAKVVENGRPIGLTWGLVWGRLEGQLGVENYVFSNELQFYTQKLYFFNLVISMIYKIVLNFSITANLPSLNSPYSVSNTEFPLLNFHYLDITICWSVGLLICRSVAVHKACNLWQLALLPPFVYLPD